MDKSVTAGAETFFVYFRCWPGLGNEFPGYGLGRLPDGQIEVEVKRLLVTQLWEDWDTLLAKWHSVGKRSRSKESRTIWHRYHDLAREVGWKTGYGCGPIIVGKEKTQLFGEQVFIGAFDSRDNAWAFAQQCAAYRDSPAKMGLERAHANHQLSNPRFGYISSRELPASQSNVIQSEIRLIHEGSDLIRAAKFALPYLEIYQAWLKDAAVLPTDIDRSNGETIPNDKNANEGSVPERMEAALMLDRTKAGWTSPKWAIFLGCTSSRVRTNNPVWDRLQRAKGKPD